MPKYEVTVSELRDYKRTYIVEASTQAEAAEKAERGETVDETDGVLNEISSREVLSTPKLVR